MTEVAQFRLEHRGVMGTLDLGPRDAGKGEGEEG